MSRDTAPSKIVSMSVKVCSILHYLVKTKQKNCLWFQWDQFKTSKLVILDMPFEHFTMEQLSIFLGFWFFFFLTLQAVTWNGQDCRLTLHWENGFLLTQASDNVEIWSYPYEKLKSSSDDAKRILWLDFGGPDGEQVSFLSLNSRFVMYIFCDDYHCFFFFFFPINMNYKLNKKIR